MLVGVHELVIVETDDAGAQTSSAIDTVRPVAQTKNRALDRQTERAPDRQNAIRALTFRTSARTRFVRRSSSLVRGASWAIVRRTRKGARTAQKTSPTLLQGVLFPSLST